ncbi:hypothetical protein C4568_00620 [Candidatus Parcubacteria bacterium]|nr:MAG: hypothetical protein C4568_00620 [Candidatus Parcubacteria bacterium]
MQRQLSLYLTFLAFAALSFAFFVPQFARAQSVPVIPDLSGIPTSQIGTPIALYIKCVLLQQVGPPIPDFATECANFVPPPGNQTGGGLTGQVIAGPGGTTPPSSSTNGGPITGEVIIGSTLTGQVVSTDVGGESGSNGGGGGGGSSGGGGNSGPGQVAGASTSNPPVGGFVPEVPDTGVGGSSLVTLLIAGAFAFGGLAYLRYSTPGLHRKF